ncbi:MAG: phosphoenolpyruvate carboxykinase domain-containing protein, partial [Casimicrobiaceae bacterium]
NMRVLKWIIERCQGKAHAVEAELGLQPEYGDLDWHGLEFGPERFAQVMRFDRARWTRELAAHDELFAKLGTKQPQALSAQRRALGARFHS